MNVVEMEKDPETGYYVAEFPVPSGSYAYSYILEWDATEEEKAAVLELNEKLHAWQQTADSPEQLETLPVLDLSEVSPDPMKRETVVSEQEGGDGSYPRGRSSLH